MCRKERYLVTRPEPFGVPSSVFLFLLRVFDLVKNGNQSQADGPIDVIREIF